MINVDVFCLTLRRCGVLMMLPPLNTLQSALEEQLETVRSSVDYLQHKLRVDLEIENHLKKRVSVLEKRQISLDKAIKNGITDLKCYHSQYRNHITNLLNDGYSSIKSIINEIDDRVRRFDQSAIANWTPQRDAEVEDHECRDVHISPQAKSVRVSQSNGSGLMELEASEKGDTSEVLALALQEKVAALLLLSQQEERHLLERNVNSALERKIEELQRNLLQVTNEKVKTLMELAQLKQEHQLLLEKLDHEAKEGNAVINNRERKLFTRERDGSLRNILKKTYLRRWISPLDVSGNEVDGNPNKGKIFNQRSTSMDFASMRIENATLKESMESMERLTSSVHRLRLSLLKAKEPATSEGTVSSVIEILNDVINEARLVKTALGSSLPISWSVEADVGSIGDRVGTDTGHHECSDEKIDTVSAAGLEMVELLIFAAEMLRDRTNQDGS